MTRKKSDSSSFRFLAEHPEYIADVKLTQFSFIIPRPLDKNYCRKKITSTIPEDDKNEKKTNHSNLKKSHPKKLGIIRKPLKLKAESGKELHNGNILSERLSDRASYIDASPLSQQLALMDAPFGEHAISNKSVIDNDASASTMHIQDSPIQNIS